MSDYSKDYLLSRCQVFISPQRVTLSLDARYLFPLKGLPSL
jgi:hypothetical protein